MNPYEHFFWNFAFFYRKPWAWKVGVGGVFPDLVYMIPFIPRLFSYGSFSEWMHDPFWDTIWSSPLAKSAHSLSIWGAVLILSFAILKKEVFSRISPFLLGWSLHIVLDALTHVSDGYALFWPLSDYRFPAFVSYWEREFHAREYFWISHSLMAGLIVLWGGWKLKGSIAGERQDECKRIACPTCEVSVLDMKNSDVASRAKSLGIRSVPAVVIDGKLAECCAGRGPDEATLRASGLGRPL